MRQRELIISAYLLLLKFIMMDCIKIKVPLSVIQILCKSLQIHNTSIAAPGALARRLQRRTACNTSLPTESKIADVVWK